MGNKSTKENETSANENVVENSQQAVQQHTRRRARQQYDIASIIASPIHPMPAFSASSPKSKYLTEDMVRVLTHFLPGDDYRKEWKLLFSSTENGHSFNRFIHHVAEKGSTIIIVKESGGHVFGGFANQSWKPKYPKFYGDDKNFVFKLLPNIEIYRPTGEDENYQYLNTLSKTLYNGLAMGGVPYLFGWVIDESFDCGHSKGVRDEDVEGSEELSETYGNPPMGSEKDFSVEYVEVWHVKDDIIPLTDEDGELPDHRSKKGKSVLTEENNVDKALRGMMGTHEFSHYHEDLKKKPNDE